jgi:hypothetical protein
MKTKWRLHIMFWLAVSSFINSGAADTLSTLDAQSLVREIETQYQGTTSHSIMRMKVVTDVWTRELVMESWSESRDRYIARIISPKKEEGTATLKIGDEMWNYLPKIDRLMKIPSSLMGDSWMGSHFTNDDLVKENKIDELYTFEIERIEGEQVSIICKPKPDAAVVWDKIIYLADYEKKMPIKIDYYDEQGDLVRTFSFDDVRNIQGRWIPMIMKIQPIDEPEESTVLVYEELEFDIKLKENQFSISSLRRF